MLITEGLAELKTLAARIAKKREYVSSYLFRAEGLKDPLEKHGGSAKALESTLQSIRDLTKRQIDIRTGIQQINLVTPLTVQGKVMTIAEWLTWRKEVAEGEQQFIATIRRTLLSARDQAKRNGASVVTIGTEGAKPQDIVVNVDEAILAKQAEELELILGELDGQLSLKNATINLPLGEDASTDK